MATISAREVLARQLEADPAFRAEWERLALARQVAALVLRYRAEHGLTQTELAQRLDVKQSAVARLESGEVNPTIETLQRLSRQLGIPIAVQIQPPATGRVAAATPTALVLSAEVRAKPPAAVSRPRASAEPPRRYGGGAGWSSLPAAAGPARAVVAQRSGAMYPKKAPVTTAVRGSTRGKAGGTAAARSRQESLSGPRPTPKPSIGPRSPKR